MQQIIRRALQRKTTPPDAWDQSSDREHEQGSGIHCRLRDADGLRRPAGEPSTGDAQMGSAEPDITDNDLLEQQIERLGKRWGGQFPDIVSPTVSGNPIVVRLGLWVFERGIRIRGGRHPPVSPTSRKRSFRRSDYMGR
jgi:hypothetical protein